MTVEHLGDLRTIVCVISADKAAAGSSTAKRELALALQNAGKNVRVLPGAGSIRRALATLWSQHLEKTYPDKTYSDLETHEKSSAWYIFHTLYDSLKVAGPLVIFNRIKQILEGPEADAYVLDTFDKDQKEFSTTDDQKAFWNLIPDSILAGLLAEEFLEPNSESTKTDVIIMEGKLSIFLPLLFPKELSILPLEYIKILLKIEPYLSAARVLQRELLSNEKKRQDIKLDDSNQSQPLRQFYPTSPDEPQTLQAEQWCLEKLKDKAFVLRLEANAKKIEANEIPEYIINDIYAPVEVWLTRQYHKIYFFNQERIEQLWQDINTSWGGKLDLPDPITLDALLELETPNQIHDTALLSPEQVVTAILKLLNERYEGFEHALIKYMAGK